MYPEPGLVVVAVVRVRVRLRVRATVWVQVRVRVSSSVRLKVSAVRGSLNTMANIIVWTDCLILHLG